MRKLDDLDRVFEQVVDSQSTNPPRSPDVPAPPLQSAALELKTAFEYDAAGNRSATVDPLLRRTEESYDGLGRVTSRSLPMGVGESFTYDGEGRVISQSDRRGVVRKHTFDVLGRPKSDVLVESISANGQELVTRTVDYVDTPGASGLTEVHETDADGHTTKRKADALHRELQVEDALQRTAYSWFDAANRRESKDRKGYRTKYVYDGVGRPIAQEDFELQGASATYTQSTTYDDASRQVTAKDRRFGSTGTTLVKELDGLGRLVQTTRGAGALIQKESTEYDGNGNPKLLTDANGHQTKSVCDGANRLVEQAKGEGEPEEATTRFKYDAAGNRLESKSLRVTGVAYDSRDSYDDLNRSVRTEDANGSVTTRAFDEAGNLLCEKRPLGGAPFAHGPVSGTTVDTLKSTICTPGYLTTFAYDEEGKFLSVTDAQGGLTSYVYDEARSLVAKQDAKLHLTTYEYDELHRRTAEHQHLSEQTVRFGRGTGALPAAAAPNAAFTSGALTWTKAYDDNGNVAWAVDAKGQRADYVYGLLDRLGSVTYSGHAAPRPALSLSSEAYGYDENGSLASVQLSKLGAAIEYTTRTFDILDRLETENRYDGKLTRYGYDKKGNRTRVTDSENVATVYTFDALDRLNTATLPAGTATYAYWEDSLPKAITLPNGVVEKRCYDAGGRLKKLVTAKGGVDDGCVVTGSIVSRYDYGYDADGNRVTQVEQRTDAVTQALRPAETTEYGYDELDRLVGVSYPDGTAHLYQLDEVGNRTGERRGPSSLVSALTVAAFLGMPVAQTTHDIQSVFNGADWLVSQTDSRDASRNVELGYDANGNLTSKVKASSVRSFQWDVRDTLASIQDDGVEVGRYDYDRSLQRTKRTTQTENVEYVLDDKFVLQEADGSQASHPATRRYHFATNALAVMDGATTSFLSVDGQGSVTDATSTSGSLTSARQYDAWGRYRNNSAPTPTEPKLGYTGHQYDTETGLIYARARYYDPELGRFLSRDAFEGSLNDAPSLNRYAYVKANPLRYWDFDGYEDAPTKTIYKTTETDEEGNEAELYTDDISKLSAKDKEARVRAANDEADEKRRRNEKLAYSIRRARAICLLDRTCAPEPLQVVEADDKPGTDVEDPAADREAVYAEGRAKTREFARQGRAGAELAFELTPLGTAKLTGEAGKAASEGKSKSAALKTGEVILSVGGFGVAAAVVKWGGKAARIAARGIRFSPTGHADVVTKGLHMVVDGVELSARPTHRPGEVVFRAVFSRDEKEAAAAIRKAEEALQDPRFRQEMADAAHKATEYLIGQKSQKAAAKSAETRFLEKALRNAPKE
ncbi:MAG: RHS repeat-associated core domain-containing protein [Myxococcaceae bacterium]